MEERIKLKDRVFGTEVRETQTIHLANGEEEMNIVVFLDDEGRMHAMDYGTYDRLKVTGVSDGFDEVLAQMSALHQAKNTDYGNAFEENLDDFGISYGVGRLYEKIKRVKSILKRGKAEVADESVKDTIFDIGVYSAILKAYMDKKK